jgi:hypothetical protein
MALAVTPGAVAAERNGPGGPTPLRGECTEGAVRASTGWRGPDAGSVQSRDSHGRIEEGRDMPLTTPNAPGDVKLPFLTALDNGLGSSDSGGLCTDNRLLNPGASCDMDTRVGGPPNLGAAHGRESSAAEADAGVTSGGEDGLPNPVASPSLSNPGASFSNPMASGFVPGREGGLPTPRADGLTPRAVGVPSNPVASSVPPTRQGAQPNPRAFPVAQGVDIRTPDAGAVRPRVSKALEVHEKCMRENPHLFRAPQSQLPLTNGSSPRHSAHSMGVDVTPEALWAHAVPMAASQGICTSGAPVLRTRLHAEEGGYPLQLLSNRKAGIAVLPDGGFPPPAGTGGRTGGPLLPSTRINAPPLALSSSPVPQGKGAVPWSQDCCSPGLRTGDPAGETVARPRILPASGEESGPPPGACSPCAQLDGMDSSRTTCQELPQILQPQVANAGERRLDAELPASHGAPLEPVRRAGACGGTCGHVVLAPPLNEAVDEPPEDHISDSETECAGRVSQLCMFPSLLRDRALVRRNERVFVCMFVFPVHRYMIL